ncbi:site-2 protease family protein [Deinococcus cellulosilyticus]|uniref:Peptidase M50 domain-containing protein n=1 Tax=Deinococcus cellulosilyticus (strain DSM 18568 / NBRC 106333 / KACC 11606 / 5516J-15) TaxID=1223518 RepID=A0A511N2K7_DEIC1|nr:M50 family metallopeptidase [Deinococcus cellulosilyticus]GEM46698.1 hypothetical protein DC3_23330 [Deinococcus cellulosilyticus NBRC 106333 = KACC 11606]
MVIDKAIRWSCLYRFFTLGVHTDPIDETLSCNFPTHLLPCAFPKGLSVTWRFGTFKGIPLHWDPLLVVFGLVWMWRHLQASGGSVFTLGWPVFLWVSVLVHELAHAQVALALRQSVTSISVHLLGGQVELEQDPATPHLEFWIAVAGPLSNLLLCLLLWGTWMVYPEVQAGLQPAFQLNLGLAVFNLLPGLPLDGGHVLRAALWTYTRDETRATRVAAQAGQVLAALVMLYGVTAGFRGNLLLMVVLVWTGGSMFRSARSQQEPLG